MIICFKKEAGHASESNRRTFVSLSLKFGHEVKVFYEIIKMIAKIITRTNFLIVNSLNRKSNKNPNNALPVIFGLIVVKVQLKMWFNVAHVNQRRRVFFLYVLIHVILINDHFFLMITQ